MKLIRNEYIEHVSSDTIIEFEKVILSDYNVDIIKPIIVKEYNFYFFIYRLLRKIFSYHSRKTKAEYITHPLNDKKHIFIVMMGLETYKYRPYGLFTNHYRSIFLFDAWGFDLDKIVDFVTTFKIDTVFVSASQSALLLKDKLANNKVHWIPEGINPQDYKVRTYQEKDIEVLALGRKYNRYHESIVDSCDIDNINYLYEIVKGQLVFPTREDFIQGLARTKISICFPSSITHPERSGDIETMTIRYLQSMVSKCLIVGHAPKEMIDLFGYNPVIEVDYTNSFDQLKKILANFTDYIPLIEKNYEIVVQNHTWNNRWNQMKDIWMQNSK